MLKRGKSSNSQRHYDQNQFYHNTNDEDDGDGPFLPLEETLRPRTGTLDSTSSLDNAIMNDIGGGADNELHHHNHEQKDHPQPQIKDKSSSTTTTKTKSLVNGKMLVWIILATIIGGIIYECILVPPEERVFAINDKFLTWVETHPGLGIGVIMIIIAGGVVSMVPIGTFLTLGCGYIYRGVYGWGIGIVVATSVSMFGSAMGAVICFLLGRYLMRDQVRQWVRKYPLLDAIDVAASEHGFRLMAMLYLTPVLPLGLVSYMCGTTSMSIYSFTFAKIASLPLYLLYTFIGASAHSFLKTKNSTTGDALAQEAKQLEENQALIASGIILSVVMMGFITRHIRKELLTILERQQKHKPGEINNFGDDSGDEEQFVEMGRARQRRPKDPPSSLEH